MWLWVMLGLFALIVVIYGVLRVLKFLQEKEDRESLDNGDIPGSFHY